MNGEQQKNRVTVEILGEKYTIKSSASAESMQQVAQYVDLLMTKIAKSNTGINRERIAVLTALNLADELLRQKQAARRFPETARERGEEDDELV